MSRIASTKKHNSALPVDLSTEPIYSIRAKRLNT